MPRKHRALTLRLPPAQFRRLAAAAGAENRSPTNYVETLLLRDLDSKDESRRVITVFAAPETTTLALGPLERNEGESDERYRERKGIVDTLLSIPDNA